MRIKRVFFVFPVLCLLLSCGGGGSPSAEELYQQTGRTALVGDFSLSDLTPEAPVVSANWAFRLEFTATYKGQVFPAKAEFTTDVFAVSGGSAELRVERLMFELVSGVPGNGTYQVRGGTIEKTGPQTGLVQYGVKLNLWDLVHVGDDGGTAFVEVETLPNLY